VAPANFVSPNDFGDQANFVSPNDFGDQANSCPEWWISGNGDETGATLIAIPGLDQIQ
jgi:hypothetical protein